MLRPLSLVIFAPLFALVIGCAADVGPDGRTAGGSCRDDLDCASGSFCLTGPDHPGGSCTTNCNVDEDCAGDAVCIEAARAGACMVPCTADEDCARQGYACRERPRRGADGETTVCVGG